MSAFDDIDNAEVFENSQKLNPEHTYDLEIVRMTERKSAKVMGMIVPIEFVVLSSSDPALPAGKVVAWVPKQASGKSFLNNLLAFALAVMGEDPSDKDAVASMKAIDPTDPQKRSHIRVLLDCAVGEGNTLAGFKVRAQTGALIKTAAGFPFMPIRWIPLA
jgi:hypothetical protein